MGAKRKPSKPAGKTKAKVRARARASAGNGKARPSRVAAQPSRAAPAPARPGDSRGKYVYCIIPASDPLSFGPIGVGAEPAPVHTVNFKHIAAVVSDTPIEVHEPTRENVLAHA